MRDYSDNIQSSLAKQFQHGQWLSAQDNVDSVLQWITFWRRNMHRFATTYLQLTLYPYQLIMLYLMNVSLSFVCIAARSAAKSFIIAIYACCRAILYPNSIIIVASSTKGQSKLIVSEKIQNELMKMSPILQLEIKRIKDNQNDIVVEFHNGSRIKVVPASENARGNRSTVIIYEEFRMIPKNIMDSILHPFQIIRQCPYLKRPEYESIKELHEEAVSIYISSSWMRSHWIRGLIEATHNDMLQGKPNTLIAFDYSVALKHNIKTFDFMRDTLRKTDPLTWAIEYENIMPTEKASAYFTYNMLTQCQTLKNVFYPRFSPTGSYKNNIPRMDGEVRILSCDIAMMEGASNDNSIFTCIRLLPESTGSDGERNKFGYRVQVPYMEAANGVDTLRQVIRIKQLEEDFDADYIVLDARSFGISIYDTGARVIYDDERGKEYQPWRCTNNEELANHVISTNPRENLYAITATSRLNNDMAVNAREMITSGKVELPISAIAAEEELVKIPRYVVTKDEYEILFYRSPYQETSLLIEEMVSLEYEKLESTGIIRLSEASGKRKDRYVSLAMGLYFALQLSRDLNAQQSYVAPVGLLSVSNLDDFFNR